MISDTTASILMAFAMILGIVLGYTWKSAENGELLAQCKADAVATLADRQAHRKDKP
jgi:hypothetical protein